MKSMTCSRQPGFNPWGALEDIGEQSSEWTPQLTPLAFTPGGIHSSTGLPYLSPLAEGASSQKCLALERAMCKEIANAQNSLSSGVLK